MGAALATVAHIVFRSFQLSSRVTPIQFILFGVSICSGVCVLSSALSSSLSRGPRPSHSSTKFPFYPTLTPSGKTAPFQFPFSSHLFHRCLPHRLRQRHGSGIASLHFPPFLRHVKGSWQSARFAARGNTRGVVSLSSQVQAPPNHLSSCGCCSFLRQSWSVRYPAVVLHAAHEAAVSSERRRLQSLLAFEKWQHSVTCIATREIVF